MKPILLVCPPASFFGGNYIFIICRDIAYCWSGSFVHSHYHLRWHLRCCPVSSLLLFVVVIFKFDGSVYVWIGNRRECWMWQIMPRSENTNNKQVVKGNLLIVLQPAGKLKIVGILRNNRWYIKLLSMPPPTSNRVKRLFNEYRPASPFPSGKNSPMDTVLRLSFLPLHRALVDHPRNCCRKPTKSTTTWTNSLLDLISYDFLQIPQEIYRSH